jgi:purine nucleosidase
MARLRLLACAAVLLAGMMPGVAAAQGRKVIVDQDARGPASTDMLSILLFLQAPDVDVLGITLVTGDQWVKEQTQRTLRATEVAGRTDVPVVPGAEYPLINTKEESEWWERQYGELSFKGAWTPRLYHPPDVIPELAEGKPTTAKPLDEHAANFIVRMVRKYPGEVTIWAGGPLTNIALALRLDPEVATLAKELVLMGAGFNVGEGGIHRINGRREFNWWFDPEAVRIAMSAPWKKITITPVDISVKTTLGDAVKERIARAGSKTAQYITKYAPRGAGGGGGGFMWDEIAALAFLDPSLITRQQELYVNIDIDHGAGYGQTIFVEPEMEAPRGQTPRQRKMEPWWRLATVQWDLDLPRFYDAFVALMSR